MARLLDFLVGHQNIIDRFLTSYVQERLPHAFLFVGPSGVGKKMTALALSQVVLCEKPEAFKRQACGLCGSCLRIARVAGVRTGGGLEATSATENLMFVEPEKNQIKIDQAKEITEFLSLRAMGRYRIVVVDQADALNPQAGNSLLKLLEEPPPGTIFFLIAPSADHVLSTLRSRSQAVAFGSLTYDQMKKRSSAPDWALHASQGSFEKLELLSDQEELQIRESACAWVEEWMKNPQGYLLQEFRDLARDRAIAARLSNHLLMIFRDAFVLKAGGMQVFNADKLPFLKKVSNLSSEQLETAVKRALLLQESFEQNLDGSLVLEKFWIETRPQV